MSCFSRSDDILLSVQQLVDEVLSIKGHSICLRIDKQVDTYLNDQAETAKQNESNFLTSISINGGDSQTPANALGHQYNELNISQDNIYYNDGKEPTQGVSTEWTEIEEVEMEITDSINDNDQVQSLTNIENITPEKECTLSSGTANTINDVKEETKVEQLSVEETGNLSSTNQPAATLSGTEKQENIDKESIVDSDKQLKVEDKITECDTIFEEKKDDTESDNATMFPKTEKYAPITEPISEDSSSCDSSLSEGDRDEDDDFNVRTINANFEQRRKSSRVRTLPLKLREAGEPKSSRNTDDTESVSSNDVETQEIVRKRGRPRLKRKDRELSISPLTIRGRSYEKHRKQRRSPSATISESSLSVRKNKLKYVDKTNESKKSKKAHHKLSDYSSYIRNSDISEEIYSRRTGRPIKQRQCYSPS